jgi:hypothetical protein
MAVVTPHYPDGKPEAMYPGANPAATVGTDADGLFHDPSGKFKLVMKGTHGPLDCVGLWITQGYVCLVAAAVTY